MADEQKNSGATGNESAGNGEQQKVEFTPVQQSKVQELIDGTFSKAFGKAKSEYEPKIAALTAEIEKLKAGGKGKDEGKNQEKGEDLSALKERLAAMETREKQSQERERRAEILTVAAELNAVSGEQVATLVASHIRATESGKLTVVNSEGQTRFNANGQPMSVKEFVSEFLTGNPHLVKAGGGMGAGSSGAKFGGGTGGVNIGSVTDIKNMSNEDLQKALKGGLSITGSGGQVFHFRKP